MDITEDIKNEWRTAAHVLKSSNPAQIILLYFSRMDQLCATNGKFLDFRHITAILHGTAQVWQTALAYHGNWQDVEEPQVDLPSFLSSKLGKLQQVMPALDARGASSILASCARLQINPDSLLPGTADRLAKQFLADKGPVTGQSYSSLLLSLVSLQLTSINSARLQQLMRSLTASKVAAFSLQDTANVLYSLAKLPSARPSSQMLNRLYSAFLQKLQSPEERSQLRNHSLANTAYSFAKLQAARPSPELLDALCGCCLERLQSYEADNNPSAQEVSTFVWALHKLKHVPPGTLAAALLGRVLSLCSTEGQQPSKGNISNFLVACADLQLAISPDEADTMVNLLLSQEGLSAQHLANTVWALSVLGLLQLSKFRQVLLELQAVAAGSGTPNAANMTQFYQALDWLQYSSSTSRRQQVELSELQDELQNIAPRPQNMGSSPGAQTAEAQGSGQLQAALTELGLHFRLGVFVNSYLINAVIEPQSGTARPLLVICSPGPDCFANDPARLTGRQVFSRQLLSQEGSLVDVPFQAAEQGVQQLVQYLQPRLEAAAGGSLDAYR